MHLKHSYRPIVTSDQEQVATPIEAESFDPDIFGQLHRGRDALNPYHNHLTMQKNTLLAPLGSQP